MMEEEAPASAAGAGAAAEPRSTAEPAARRKRCQRVVMLRGVVTHHPPRFVAAAGQHASCMGVLLYCGRTELAPWLQVWRSDGFTTQLWADMMRFWPAPFEGPMTQPREALVAHAGTHGWLP